MWKSKLCTWQMLVRSLAQSIPFESTVKLSSSVISHSNNNNKNQFVSTSWKLLVRRLVFTSWVCFTVYMEFCMFYPCPFGFPQGSLVSIDLPKTYSCIKWLLGVNECAWCTAIRLMSPPGCIPIPHLVFWDILQINHNPDQDKVLTKTTKCRLYIKAFFFFFYCDGWHK